MTFKGIVLGFCLAFVSFSSFAADQVVKEETNPPAAEDAITADEIPPMVSINQANTQAKVPTPATTTPATIPPGPGMNQPTTPSSGQ